MRPIVLLFVFVWISFSNSFIQLNRVHASGVSPLCANLPSGAGVVTAFNLSSYIGNCSEEITPTSMIAAVPTSIFNSSRSCGQCIEITRMFRPPVTLRIAELSNVSSIDLPPAAFAAVTGDSSASGSYAVDYRLIDCPVGAQLVNLSLLNGSNPWFLNVKIHQHRHAIQSVIVVDANNVTHTGAPTSYGTYVVTGTGQIMFPAQFYVEDIYGGLVEVPAPTLQLLTWFQASNSLNGGQFPACSLFRNGFE